MGRYKIVACTDCENVWIIDGRPKTSMCRTCGRTHQFKKLRVMGEFDEIGDAREGRAYVKAIINDEVDEFEELRDNGKLDEVEKDFSMVETETYLQDQGIDINELQEAGEQAINGNTGGSSQNPKEVVKQLIEKATGINRDQLIEEAGKKGVSEQKAERMLERLHQEGEIYKSGTEYKSV